MEKLNVAYSTIQQVLTKAPSYYVSQGDGGYEILVIGENTQISSRIFGTDTSAKQNFENNFKNNCTSVPSPHDALVLGNIANKIPLVSPRLADGRIRTSSEKTIQNRTTIFTPNWTDPTTWYQTSEYIENEVATDSGDHTTYTLSHTNIIDAYHGKITFEDFLKDSNNRSYKVSVKVDGYSKNEQDPHYGTGGDYTVNYSDGYITFLSSLSQYNTVTASYHYMVDSLFIIKPYDHKDLRIDLTEVQFSEDIEITDSVIFQPYGLVDVFAPELVSNNIVPTGTKIPLGDPALYKTIADYMNDATKSYPSYAPLGGTGWRGCGQKMTVMDWDYVSSTVLKYDYGMEIRVYLEHNKPFGGSFATTTFYCVLEEH